MTDDGLSFLMNLLISVLASAGMVLIVNAMVDLFPADLGLLFSAIFGGALVCVSALIAILAKRKFSL